MHKSIVIILVIMCLNMHANEPLTPRSAIAKIAQDTEPCSMQSIRQIATSRKLFDVLNVKNYPTEIRKDLEKKYEEQETKFWLPAFEKYTKNYFHYFPNATESECNDQLEKHFMECINKYSDQKQS